MFFIWRGVGWLVPLITFGSFLMMELIGNAYHEDAYDEMVVFKAIATVMSTLLIALLGYRVNIKQVPSDESSSQMIMNEKKSIKRVFTGRKSTFMFIPVQYWALIIAVFSIWGYNDYLTENELTKTYLKKPKIGDIYIVDLDKLFESYNDKISFSAWRFNDISDNNLEFIISDYAYKNQYHVEKALREGGVIPMNAEKDDMRSISFDALEELFDEHSIVRVIRDTDNI